MRCRTDGQRAHLLSDVKCEAIFLLLCVPTGRVEVKVLDIAVLEIFGKTDTVVCEMGFFAASDNKITPLFIEVEELFDERFKTLE